MSVIFQTLQKLEHGPADQPFPGAIAPLPGPKQPLLLRRWLRPAALLALCLVFGLVAIGLARHFTSAAPADNSVPDAALWKMPVPDKPDHAERPAAQAAQYHPPRPRPNSAEPEAAAFAQSPESAGPSVLLASIAYPQPAAAPAKASSPVSEPLIEAEAVSVPAASVTAPSEDAGAKVLTIPGDDDRERLASLRNEAEAMGRQVRIQTLTETINGSLRAGGDDAQTETLLAELAQLKGNGHPYVLKLRGCWLLKQGRLDEAASLFTRLAGDDPEDLEAGVNLALIEMQQGQRSKALERLIRLGRVYPDNALVSDLRRRLQ